MLLSRGVLKLRGFVRRVNDCFRLVCFFDKPFSLCEGVYLVKGAAGGAIYDLNSGHVYSLDPLALKIVENVLSGATPKNIALQEPAVNLFDVLNFLHRLTQLGLGKWDEVFQSRFNEPDAIPPPQTKLRFAWLELTHSCNLNCVHCYSNSSAGLRADNELTNYEWQKLISDLAKVGCTTVQFTGGEPLLVPWVTDVIKLANQAGLNIELFTNLTLLTAQHAVVIEQYDARVATSIYSSDPTIHDTITQTEGSFEKTVQGIRVLKARGVPIRVAIIALPLNAERLQETMNFVREELGIDEVSMGPVLPVGRGREVQSILHDWLPHSATPFPLLSREEFTTRVHGHSCWHGRLCISPSGDVLPCPFVRSWYIENVRRQSLSIILHSDRLLHAWGLSKDHIEICCDCEFRYACFDCRAKGSTLFGKPLGCVYNPYTGVWDGTRESDQAMVKPKEAPFAVRKLTLQKGGDRKCSSQ